MLLDIESNAAALYDGGWRSDDGAELMDAYQLTPEEVDEIVALLATYEERSGKDDD